MRNKKIAVYLCMSLLLTTVGCSHSTVDSDVSTADTSNYNDITDPNDDSQQDNNKDFVQQSNIAQSQADSIPSQTDHAQSPSTSELDGNIESIGDNSVVISEILHPSEEMAVSSDQSVTVCFSEETEFEVITVRNGGVNKDADVEKRQGSFSDLEQGATISMTGYYDENDFHAKKVMIYHFV